MTQALKESVCPIIPLISFLNFYFSLLLFFFIYIGLAIFHVVYRFTYELSLSQNQLRAREQRARDVQGMICMVMCV